LPTKYCEAVSQFIYETGGDSGESGDRIRIDLHTSNHAFLKGHRIMVQVQSTWFPLYDRNPQKFVSNIFLARDSDYVAANSESFSQAVAIPRRNNSGDPAIVVELHGSGVTGLKPGVNEISEVPTFEAKLRQAITRAGPRLLRFLFLHV
jgi:hypothetical protein